VLSTPLVLPAGVVTSSAEGGEGVADGPVSGTLSVLADTAQSLVIDVPRAADVEASGASESGETS
jgi:hypothetical protein